MSTCPAAGTREAPAWPAIPAGRAAALSGAAGGRDLEKQRWQGYAAGAAVTALCTGLGWASGSDARIDHLAMIYLLGVMLVAMQFGRGARSSRRTLSVGAFDFFSFRHDSLAVSDVRFLITFA